MNRSFAVLILRLVTILIGGATLATNLQAQSDPITLHIPFPFTLGEQNIAPGTYEFSLESNQFLLSVLDVRTGKLKIFEVHPEQQRAIEQHGRLVFSDSIDGSVLNEVHFPGTSIFSEVIYRRHADRASAKKMPPDDSVVVAAR